VISEKEEAGDLMDSKGFNRDDERNGPWVFPCNYVFYEKACDWQKGELLCFKGVLLW